MKTGRMAFQFPNSASRLGNTRTHASVPVARELNCDLQTDTGIFIPSPHSGSITSLPTSPNALITSRTVPFTEAEAVRFRGVVGSPTSKMSKEDRERYILTHEIYQRFPSTPEVKQRTLETLIAKVNFALARIGHQDSSQPSFSPENAAVLIHAISTSFLNIFPAVLHDESFSFTSTVTHSFFFPDILASTGEDAWAIEYLLTEIARLKGISFSEKDAQMIFPENYADGSSGGILAHRKQRLHAQRELYTSNGLTPALLCAAATASSARENQATPMSFAKEYEAQLASTSTRSYALDDLRVQAMALAKDHGGMRRLFENTIDVVSEIKVDHINTGLNIGGFWGFAIEAIRAKQIQALNECCFAAFEEYEGYRIFFSRIMNQPLEFLQNVIIQLNSLLPNTPKLAVALNNINTEIEKLISPTVPEEMKCRERALLREYAFQRCLYEFRAKTLQLFVMNTLGGRPSKSIKAFFSDPNRTGIASINSTELAPLDTSTQKVVTVCLLHFAECAFNLSIIHPRANEEAVVHFPEHTNPGFLNRFQKFIDNPCFERVASVSKEIPANQRMMVANTIELWTLEIRWFLDESNQTHLNALLSDRVLHPLRSIKEIRNRVNILNAGMGIAANNTAEQSKWMANAIEADCFHCEKNQTPTFQRAMEMTAEQIQGDLETVTEFASQYSTASVSKGLMRVAASAKEMQGLLSSALSSYYSAEISRHCDEISKRVWVQKSLKVPVILDHSGNHPSLNAAKSANASLERLISKVAALDSENTKPLLDSARAGQASFVALIDQIQGKPAQRIAQESPKAMARQNKPASAAKPVPAAPVPTPVHAPVPPQTTMPPASPTAQASIPPTRIVAPPTKRQFNTVATAAGMMTGQDRAISDILLLLISVPAGADFENHPFRDEILQRAKGLSLPAANSADSLSALATALSANGFTSRFHESIINTMLTNACYSDPTPQVIRSDLNSFSNLNGILGSICAMHNIFATQQLSIPNSISIAIAKLSSAAKTEITSIFMETSCIIAKPDHSPAELQLSISRARIVRAKLVNGLSTEMDNLIKSSDTEITRLNAIYSREIQQLAAAQDAKRSPRFTRVDPNGEFLEPDSPRRGRRVDRGPDRRPDRRRDLD